jgi:predicted oxidoreductase
MSFVKIADALALLDTKNIKTPVKVSNFSLEEYKILKSYVLQSTIRPNNLGLIVETNKIHTYDRYANGDVLR